MEVLTCPGCGAQMVKEQEPDIIIDRCPRCKGVFLDRGELNVLATGAAGDIEYSPIDLAFYADHFPVRRCPKCSEREMKKVSLLRLPDLVFDLCPGCNGFYLDRGECEAMNEALRKRAPKTTAQEFRGEKNGHLVRIDRVDHVIPVTAIGFADHVVESSHVGVSVYYHDPLTADLRILQHRWTTLLARLFGLVAGKKITTGNEKFDHIFTVHSADKKTALALLRPEFLERMVAFDADGPSVFGTRGALTVSRISIGYSEGPYHAEETADMVARSKAVVDRLLELAELIDTSAR